jgi:drug/metabolite transporter (DMT)-like permease
MRLALVLLLIVYSFGLSLGQMLFKISAERVKDESGARFVVSLFGSAHFLFACVVYFGLTLVWVWLLTRVPLSRAYPFVVLAFVFTPVLASLVFGEPITRWYVIGLALIIVGLTVLVWKAS